MKLSIIDGRTMEGVNDECHGKAVTLYMTDVSRDNLKIATLTHSGNGKMTRCIHVFWEIPRPHLSNSENKVRQAFLIMKLIDI